MLTLLHLLVDVGTNALSPDPNDRPRFHWWSVGPFSALGLLSGLVLWRWRRPRSRRGAVLLGLLPFFAVMLAIMLWALSQFGALQEAYAWAAAAVIGLIAASLESLIALPVVWAMQQAALTRTPAR